MKRTLILGAIIAPMLWSCSEEQLVTDQTVANTTSQSVEVTPEGFLSFSTFEDLEAYLNAAEQEWCDIAHSPLRLPDQES